MAQEFPNAPRKTLEQIKKKWENLLCEARKAAGVYRQTLRSTGRYLLFIVINMHVLMCVFLIGGGPAYKWKHEYLENIYHHILGSDHPTIRGGIIVSLLL